MLEPNIVQSVTAVANLRLVVSKLRSQTARWAVVVMQLNHVVVLVD